VVPPGASSGVLYYGSGTNYVPAVELFGKVGADNLWKETAEVIDTIVATASKDEIDCGLRTCGALMVAKNESQVEEIQTERSGVSSLGLPARFLSRKEVKEILPLQEFLGGLAFDGVGQIHPAQFSSGLAADTQLQVYEGTSSLSWTEGPDGVVVKTPNGQIRASHVVIATNNEPCLGYEEFFEIESSVILASQETGRVKEVFPAEKIIWTMEDRYDMFYPRGERLILELYELGYEQAKIAQYFPGIPFSIEHTWGECWAKPKDWLPIMGKVSKRAAVSIGMGDQGIIMSWLCGSKMPAVLDGKGDWFTERASPQRFKTASGREIWGKVE
jgi:glycine/D-amino acid oxidase-like deaminating enzyme